MNRDINGFFEMLAHGYCGYIKKTERVQIKEVDEHDLATVICGTRTDMIPYKELKSIDERLDE